MADMYYTTLEEWEEDSLRPVFPLDEPCQHDEGVVVTPDILIEWDEQIGRMQRKPAIRIECKHCGRTIITPT